MHFNSFHRIRFVRTISQMYSFSNHFYTVFQKLKAERELTIEREYEKTMTEIKRIEGIIEQQKRFNQARNYITIASKEKQIERIKAELKK